jgi:uncharacterized membrane protein YphA (DoxX/SURF4 family)
VLRLTLAAIFIFHGVTKITGPGNDWGAAWATNMWQLQGKVPQTAMAELEKGRDRLKKEGEKLSPESEEGKDNLKKQEEVQLAEERIKAAFAASAPLPDALSYQGVQLAVAWGELVCGVALLLGLWTRVAALGLIVIMGGAIYMVTGARGFADPASVGYEYNLAILAICLVLVIMGSGRLSVDGLRGTRRRAVAQHQQPVAV